MNTVAVPRELLERVMHLCSEHVNAFEASETWPDGEIKDAEVREALAEEKAMLAELQQALAPEQPEYSDAELNCRACFGPCGQCEQPSEGSVGRYSYRRVVCTRTGEERDPPRWDIVTPAGAFLADVDFEPDARKIVDALNAVQCKQCLASSRLHFPCGDDPKPYVASAWNNRAALPGAPVAAAAPKFHYTMPDTQAIRTLQVEVERLKQLLVIYREVGRGFVGKGTSLEAIERAEKRIEELDSDLAHPANDEAVRKAEEKLKLVSEERDMWLRDLRLLVGGMRNGALRWLDDQGRKIVSAVRKTEAELTRQQGGNNG